MTTTATAIARIVKKDIGFPTVPWGELGVHVTKGARKGTVFIDCNFSAHSTARRRMATIAEGLRAKGYSVSVTEDGVTAHVSKEAQGENAAESARLRRFAEETDGQIDDLAHKLAHHQRQAELVAHEMAQLEAARATALQEAAYLDRCDAVAASK